MGFVFCIDATLFFPWQSVFLVEDLEPFWLGLTRGQEVAYRTIAILFGGLSGGLMGWLSLGLVGGLIGGVIGLFGGLSGALTGMQVGWQLGSQFYQPSAWQFGGVVGALIALLGSGKGIDLVETITWKWIIPTSIFDLTLWLIRMLIAVLIAALIGGLMGGRVGGRQGGVCG